MMFVVLQLVFRKIADVKRERELAETRKNEGFDQIGSDHPVRKLISKFRKISQESRAAQNIQNAPTPPNVPAQSSPQQTSPSLANTQNPTRTIPTDSNDSSPTMNTDASVPQHLQIPSTGKTRDKLETISERIETQESQISQITSVHQSPPLHRPPRSSKWKWLKTGSTGPESPPRGTIPTIKPSPPQQQRSPNPFDTNLIEENEEGERRLSIPMSLFIPRTARRDSAKTSDEGTDDNVRIISSFEQNNQQRIFFLFHLIRNN